MNFIIPKLKSKAISVFSGDRFFWGNERKYFPHIQGPKKRDRRAIPPWAIWSPDSSSDSDSESFCCPPPPCSPCCSDTPCPLTPDDGSPPWPITPPCSPCCSYTPSSPPSYQFGSPPPCSPCCSPVILDTFSCSSCSLRDFGYSSSSSYTTRYSCSSCTSKPINSIDSIDSSSFSCSLSSCSLRPGDSSSLSYSCSSCSNSTEGIELTLRSLRCRGESYCRLSSPSPSPIPIPIPPPSCPFCPPLPTDSDHLGHYIDEDGDWVFCMCCSDSGEDGRENSGPCRRPFSGKFLLLFWNICLMPFVYNIFVNV